MYLLRDGTNRRFAALATIGLFTTCACGDDAAGAAKPPGTGGVTATGGATSSGGTPASGGSSNSGGTEGNQAGASGSGGEAPSDPPLYAVMYEVFDDVGSNSYLALIDSLDLPAVDSATSREFAGGRAFLQSYNGWVFVGDPTSPVVTRYSVSRDGALTEDGSVSFANYGLSSGVIDRWVQTFISPTKAYLFDPAQGTHIIWNPTTLKITGEIEPTDEFFRDGLTVDTSPAAVRGNRLFRAIYWGNYDTAEFSQDQLLAVYDLETDSLLEAVPETRCPNPGNLVHRDEAGNLYFSNWIWPIAGTLMHDAAANCVLRINADSERYDPDWSLEYADLSGGHEGGMFTYLADGQGLVSIFDETQTSFDATTDPWAYAGSSYWSIWSVDIESRAASPIEGIPPNAGAYTPLHFEGRSFVMVPKSDWSSTRLYEISGHEATPGMDIPGWSYMFEKVR